MTTFGILYALIVAVVVFGGLFWPPAGVRRRAMWMDLTHGQHLEDRRRPATLSDIVGDISLPEWGCAAVSVVIVLSMLFT